ncbi:HEAT repeat domain-containing protein [Fischerella sp. PCC 9605]|uniref:HEAT repeat domain-containing protein n=1 Tax=Fischerella sp. PCC 9605 TaxID=1173024 RepID=UPI00047ED701|nr:HEAT repeat domain-containing protein [Fischerella sp. PCC 9605]
MAKSRKKEEMLSLLSQIQENPTTEEAIASLRQVLNSKYSVAIARTAKIVGKFAIVELIPDLVAAFARMMVNPTVTDQGCLAKKEIAETLYRLEYSDENLFLEGIRHVQMEPIWGGKEDTAAHLRGICALGLVRMNYSDVMNELADLLADPKPEARVAATRAIAYSANPQGVPLLRLKVRIGDPAPQVLSECFTALLQLAPQQSLPLVASFLVDSEEQICELAALALGESRLDAAFDTLKNWWERTRSAELRRTGLLAIAMLRHDQALEFLISLVAEGKDLDAKDAIAALSIYREDYELWQRVYKAAEQRADISFLQAIAMQS